MRTSFPSIPRRPACGPARRRADNHERTRCLWAGHRPCTGLADRGGIGAAAHLAHGDFAIECGFERRAIAEIQEEIHWICEAAHVAVIWATQLLEALAQTSPSRAECVMLNMGLNVVAAVRVLDDFLRRVQAHHANKRSMLRKLHLAHMLLAEPDAGTDQGRP